MRIVVALISWARTILAPMAGPAALVVLYPTSTNVEAGLTAIGSVTSTESKFPEHATCCPSARECLRRS